MTLSAATVLLLVLAGCSSGSSHENGRQTTQTVTRSTDAASVAIRLTEVGRASQPTAMIWCAGRADPLVAEKGGRVRELGGDTVLDLSGEVSTGGEQGLLGIACRDDLLYVSYTNRAGDTRVEEVTPDGGRRGLLAVDQPAANHNGGNIAFGPDGRLWLGLGDGGGRDDRYGNAQESGELLGSMLRLDPAEPSPEIVVKGARNPWRWSFDRATGELWIGDVGQDATEEIDRLPAGVSGANLGWPAYEGSTRYRDDVASPADPVMPVFEYGRDEGQSVVGGFVYRGRAIAALVGHYVFADTYAARIRLLDDGRELAAVPGGLVSSFAEDPAGELYVLSLDGGIFRLDPAGGG